MKYLDKNDEELLNTIILMSNFPSRSERIEAQMEKYYIDNPNNAEAAFAYGLLNMIKSSKKENSLSTQNVDVFFEAYERVLKIIPDYWLVHALKANVLLSISEIVRYDEELLETLDALLQMQDCTEQKEAYFIFPYICRAEYAFIIEEDRQKCVDFLAKGEKAIPIGTIKFPILKKYLFARIQEFMKKIHNANDYEIESKVKILAKKYFTSDNQGHQNVTKLRSDYL
ncbi:hypothetical protein [Ruminiclostridium papyrosolvens]|uniref:Uncharacterized protein n=1 Tax=Ruminiclostridium papyrosolvens C7 TaxID=1330534 RepID=U4R1F6_9FIRM|nr:hypothetical protein [Ruminiclostridium papyrosolvens]EPR10505.1 hypothetical protein L323_12995 [Ruminiclostridium papyrosolvens C7]